MSAPLGGPMQAMSDTLLEMSRKQFAMLDDATRLMLHEAMLRAYTRLALEYQPPAKVAELLRMLAGEIDEGAAARPSVGR